MAVRPRYGQHMVPVNRPLSHHGGAALLASLAAIALAVTGLSSAMAAPAPRSGAGLGAAAVRSLLSSRELWATVDACGPKDQPNTIGVRGSMPGDGSAKDIMYMRFTVQYYDFTAKRWTSLGKGADSGFVKVGSANVVRQAGRNFQFARTPGKPSFRLRGVVFFQWRHAARVLAEATRPTTARHKSLAGADPHGYSAGTCKLE